MVKDGKLSLYGSSTPLNDYEGSTTFACYRQQDHSFSAQTCLELKNARKGDQAGLSLYMDTHAHYDIFLQKKGGKQYVTVCYHLGDIEHTEDFPVPSSKIWLKVSGDPYNYFMSWSADGKSWNEVGKQMACYLSSETNWGFTGIMIGLWAYSPDEDGTVKPSDFRADFECFKYSKQ